MNLIWTSFTARNAVTSFACIRTQKREDRGTITNLPRNGFLSFGAGCFLIVRLRSVRLPSFPEGRGGARMLDPNRDISGRIRVA